MDSGKNHRKHPHKARAARRHAPGLVALLIAAASLTGCLVMSGTYRLTAEDRAGAPLSKVVLIAEGGRIYGSRNALCQAFPGAIVRIWDVHSGEELRSESPYTCRP